MMAATQHFVVCIGFVGLVVSACGGGLTSAATTPTEFNDTWLWNGDDWSPVQASAAPPPRTEASLAYDAATHQVVLFGGRTTTDLSFLNDTWTWDGRSWSLRHPIHSPDIRDQAGLVFDPALQALLLVGGFVQKRQADGSTYIGGLDDVWKWDGTDWSLVGHTGFPTGLSGADRSGYDLASHEVVVIADNQTLSWDGTSWRNVTNPLKWQGADVAYTDPASGVLTAIASFANPDNSLTYRLETWKMGAWDDGPVIPLPSAMDQGWLDIAAAAYDSKRNQVVTFGGGCMNNPGSLTLLFSGATWSVATPAHIPPGRTYAFMAFDADRGVTVMFGGSTSGAVNC